MSFLALLAILGGAAYAGEGVVSGAFVQVQDRILSSDVRAQQATALSLTPGRPAELAIDTFDNRSWASEAISDTRGQYLEFSFEREFRLVEIFITGGASSDQNIYITERRPRTVQVIASQTDGQTTKEFVLKDITAKQPFPVGVDHVSKVKLLILDSVGPEGAPVAVAEVQFRGR